MSVTTGVLFVCMGNICRSPMAKFVFDDLVAKRALGTRFDVDSCGTGAWHAGEAADPRTVAVAGKYGLDTGHTARGVRARSDFERFEYLVAMDLDNRRRLVEIGAPLDRVHLLRAFDPVLKGRPDAEIVVPDPYYGGEDGFEKMYTMIRAGCEGLLEHTLSGRG